MGTNYAVSVTYNDKEMIRQYGQSDGHPSTIIPYIMRFLGSAENVRHLKRNIVKCKFDSPTSPVMDNDLWLSIHNSVGYWKNLINSDSEVRWLEKEGFSRQEIFEYLRRLRNTGVAILDVMIKPWADESDIIYMWKARTTSTESDGFFAAYNIDLDQKKVFCEWLRHRMEFDFDDAPGYDMIERFECYELGKNFKLKDWSKFVYVIRENQDGKYYKYAFTNYDRAVRELKSLNQDVLRWGIEEIRLPWVGRSICYVTKRYKDGDVDYSHVYSCNNHAKTGSMWAGAMEFYGYHPEQCELSDVKLIDREYDRVFRIERIRVIKEA